MIVSTNKYRSIAWCEMYFDIF